MPAITGSAIGTTVCRGRVQRHRVGTGIRDADAYGHSRRRHYRLTCDDDRLEAGADRAAGAAGRLICQSRSSDRWGVRGCVRARSGRTTFYLRNGRGSRVRVNRRQSYDLRRWSGVARPAGDLPHYWSDAWLRPEVESFGTNPDQFFASAPSARTSNSRVPAHRQPRLTLAATPKSRVAGLLVTQRLQLHDRMRRRQRRDARACGRQLAIPLAGPGAHRASAGRPTSGSQRGYYQATCNGATTW